MITTTKPADVEILILGAGWTSTFLIPLLKKQNISFGATSTTGRDGTFKFKFEHDECDEAKKQYRDLPAAKTVLITFPLKGKGESSHLVKSYSQAHGGEESKFQFIQLGSTGIFTIPGQDTWVTRHSKMLTDLIVYDWWALILGFAGELQEEDPTSNREHTQIKWVGEVMVEQNVKALPRSMEQLGRCYDTREFWTTFELMPIRARI
ncbi:hypothetical protein M7I_4792 [Glarea lozoyensis 74030]|uniref:Uncharacterized protein n=1 Tax=Glarea lozoyensis (strain ATCC 74030 / MF5533) TaxID=1104152 RepID=H0EQ49_GLAL7|nr:hypothetical protein M7I_4792 [Glarea lozoyensis 74030]